MTKVVLITILTDISGHLYVGWLLCVSTQALINVVQPVCPPQTTANATSWNIFSLVFLTGSQSFVNIYSVCTASATACWRQTSVSQCRYLLYLVVMFLWRIWYCKQRAIRQDALNSSALSAIRTSLCPLFTSSWPQREALHLMRPSGCDVDKNYSCNHLGFGAAPLWISNTCL